MSNAPCHGCPDRHEACHDRCERYKTWKAPIEAEYETRRISMMLNLDKQAKAEKAVTTANRKHRKG